MANANGSVISVSWNGTPLPTLPLSGVALNKSAELEDVTPYGTQDQVYAYGGLRKRAPIKTVLLYDDTASTGENALFNGNEGTSGTLLLTWKSGKTSSMTAFIQSVETVGTVGKMTKQNVTFQPSGAITET